MSDNLTHSEEEKLKAFSNETVNIAEEYADARFNYAVAKVTMDNLLREAYEKQSIKDSMAIDKAYIQLTINNPEAQEAYNSMVKEEQTYKGMEAILSARASKVSLHQSLIKNQQMVKNQ